MVDNCLISKLIAANTIYIICRNHCSFYHATCVCFHLKWCMIKFQICVFALNLLLPMPILSKLPLELSFLFCHVYLRNFNLKIMGLVEIIFFSFHFFCNQKEKKKTFSFEKPFHKKVNPFHPIFLLTFHCVNPFHLE